MIQKHSELHNYGVDISKCAKIWRGGCIIRADFLNDVSSHYTNATKNLLMIPFFKTAVEDRLDSWRKVVLLGTLQGFPIPLYSSCLAYFDSYISDSLSANLIQGLRDFFGAHTYERIDKSGKFHTDWESEETKPATTTKAKEGTTTDTGKSTCCLLI